MAAREDGSVSLNKIGGFTNAEGSGAESTAYDAATNRLFVGNTEANSVDVLSLADPGSPQQVLRILMPSGLEIADLDLRGNVLATALATPNAGEKGSVAFYDAADGDLLRQVEVGFTPDEVQFSPNGKTVAVSNSGEPDFDDLANPVDPPGSISLIDISKGFDRLEIRSIDFSQFDGQEAALREQGIRIRPDASSSADFAPEGVTFAAQDELWVSLQQNNALAAISAGKNGLTIERLVPLGAKDHGFADDDLEISYGLDASDRDGRINIQNWPVFGFYGPDEIASFKVRGDTYFIITNEGDPTEIPVNGELIDETARVRDLALDPAAFPDAAQLRSNENLGRLQVSRFEGDSDGDGDKDVLYAYGARSFSILDDDGSIVFDSGDDFEQVVAARIPSLFNAPIDANTFDDRSDNRGPQPEGIAIGKVEGRTYAFIGLHTQGGVMAYDVTDPRGARFVDYINTREEAAVGGDLGTKGLSFISADASPTGKPLIAASHSESGTVAIYEFETQHDGDWLL